jgi:hypothetical protein
MSKHKGTYPRTFEYVDHEGNMAHIELRIGFTLTPGCPAQIYGDPSRCYPAEDAEWEFEGAERRDDGVWVPIPDTDWLAEWCQAALDAAYEDDICNCLPDDRE